jgi:xylulokinase
VPSASAPTASRPSDPTAPLTLGIDLGTSAVKVVLLAPGVRIVGESAAAFPTTSALPQQAEQDPADWLRALSSAMQMLGESAAASEPDWSRRIAAIGLTGQLPTLVCLSEHGPAAPAITWKDGRADAWAAGRIDSAAHSAMYRVTGMPTDGRYLAPMLNFHFAQRLGGLRCILSAKDYLLSVLTGMRTTEPTTAAGYGIYDLRGRRFSETLSDFWQVPHALLPSIRPANSLAGPLTAEGAALLGLPAGVPVSTGAADSVCAAYAMAGLHEGVVSISFGSSAVVVGACQELRLDADERYLVTPHVLEPWYGREMDLLASGTGYEWLSGLFGWPDGRIDVEARGSSPGANGLFFPPYLAGGEQGALWNPRLRGAVLGLNLRHTPGDIARAYLEGVFFEIRRCIDVLAETAPVDEVRVSGGLVASRSTLQMLADIVQRPVGVTPYRSPAAAGAAQLAGHLAAREPSSPGAAPMPSPPPPALTPSAGVHPQGAGLLAYADLYQEYLVRAAACE